MILRCTAKLLKELGATPSECLGPEGDLESWHANLLRIDRRKCLLVTNDATLYSVFVPALRKPQFQGIADVCGQAIFRSLRLAGFTQDQIEAALDALHGEAGFQFAKTNNRRVIGSMNDLRFQIEWIIESDRGLERCAIDEVNARINRIPMSAIRPHTYSVDALRDRLDALLA